MKCKTGTFYLGGTHSSAVAMVIPAKSGDSSRTMSLFDGREWMGTIRKHLHAMASKMNGGTTPLATPAVLKKKNVTRWATGRTEFPVDYRCVVDLGLIDEWTLWYLLDCEACFETLWKIMHTDKKVGNLKMQFLNSIKAQPDAAYVVAESLVLTVNGPSEEERANALVDLLNEQRQEMGQYSGDSSDDEQPTQGRMTMYSSRP